MDTGTVLKIIKMLDAGIDSIDPDDHKEFDTPSRDELPDYQYALGQRNSLEHFRDHLQSFIEAQLNAEENKSTEQ